MGKEIRNVKMIFKKDGHGNLSTRISIPKNWSDRLGFSVDEREAEIIFDEEKEVIIIKKNKAGLISCFLCYKFLKVLSNICYFKLI